MDYVKESIERVVALESCDGRYKVYLHNQVPGSDGYEAELRAAQKDIESYEETVCCKAYHRLAKERRVLRQVIWGVAGYDIVERDVPGWDVLHRFLNLMDAMLNDSRDDSYFYVFRPETAEDITDMCYLGDMTECGFNFSTNVRGEGSYFAGGAELKPGRVYVLRTRYGELGKVCDDTQLECYDAEKFISCAKELMDGMARYLDGAFDKKEAENGADKQ